MPAVAKLQNIPRVSLRKLLEGDLWDYVTYIITVEISGALK